MELEIFTQTMKDFLNQNFMRIELSSILNIFLIVFGILIFITLIKKILINFFKKAAEKTSTEVDDILLEKLEKIGIGFYATIGIYLAIISINQELGAISPFYIKIASAITTIISAFYLSEIIQSGTVLSLDRIIKNSNAKGRSIEPSLIHIAEVIVNILTWSVALLIVLQIFGINITALLAGFGIGGIAIAFALQNVLSDLFASVSIYLDRPFKTGDFIQIGDDLGEVKKIGIKSTRLTTLQGEQMVVANKELSDTRIQNYNIMRKRRISFKIGVTYSTSHKKLIEGKKAIQEIIESTEKAEFDRVHFFEFGDFSLNFEIVYFVLSKDFNLYMDIQEEISLKMVQAFEKLGIEFAFPTQTIELKR